MLTGIRPGLEGVCHLSYYLVRDLEKTLCGTDFRGEDKRDESLLSSKLNERYLASSDIWRDRQPLMEQGIKHCPLSRGDHRRKDQTQTRETSF